MAASTTEIANMAISHLGEGQEIGDLPTESSQEAKACRRFYQTALDQTLRDFDWGFASKQVQLSLVQTFTPGTGYEFQYAYRYPTNCVKLRRILSGARVDTPESRIAFKETQDASGRLIYTDAGPNNYFNVTNNIVAEITANDTAVEFYPADFVLAFSYMLASLIAPRLSPGDPLNMSGKCLQKYMLNISMAKKNDVQESAPDVPYDSELIRVREGGGSGYW